MLALFLFVSAVSAAIVTVSAPAGPVISTSIGSPEQIAGFVGGEQVTMEFSVNDATPDTAGPGSGIFNDPLGFVRGASVVYQGGLTIVVNSFRISASSTQGSALAGVTPTIQFPVNYSTGGPVFFSNPDSLVQVLADLQASSFPNTSPSGLLPQTTYWNSGSATNGM
jgi:hypothetical protein